jgi:hypothetical protein
MSDSSGRWTPSELGATGSCTIERYRGAFDARRYDATMLSPARLALLAGSMTLALAACQATSGSISPASSPTPAAPASNALPPSVVIPSTGATSSPEAGQTDTDWGRIWDSLPSAFPSYPGSAPAEEASTGPASAVLAVPGTDARAVAVWMQSTLEQGSYRTEALSGPLENGGFVLDSNGPAPGCRVQVSVAPIGALTIVTVLYGAICPKP